MVNTLALMLSPEERKRSRYAVDTLANDSSDFYDSDLFVQGLLKVPIQRIQYKVPQNNTILIEWQAVRKISYEILRVKGL